MAAQALAIGPNLVIAPAELPVSCTVAFTIGLTAAGAASGPSVAASALFTWPSNTAGAYLGNVQGSPAVPPGYTALYVNVAATATISYPS